MYKYYQSAETVMDLKALQAAQNFLPIFHTGDLHSSL